MKVACLGPEQSFSHLVTKKLFPEARLVFLQAYKGCQRLKKGQVSYAIYPLENNVVGYVNETLHAIYQTAKISIVGLNYVKIEQNLISDCKHMTDIEAIHSHPQAIAQCQKKIEELQKRKGEGEEIKIVKLSSTSQGVVEASKNHKIAAIGSWQAAEQYGVPILKKSFQDKSRNVTRFVTLQIGGPPKASGKDRTMFIVEVSNDPGSLAQVLNHIDSLSINCLSLQTHPVYRGNEFWEYAFFIEVEGHATNEPLKTVCKTLGGKRLRGQTRKGRLVGSYSEKNEIEL